MYCRAISAGYRAVHTEEKLSAYSHGSSVREPPGGSRRHAPSRNSKGLTTRHLPAQSWYQRLFSSD